jgi:hypothetical protein
VQKQSKVSVLKNVVVINSGMLKLTREVPKKYTAYSEDRTARKKKFHVTVADPLATSTEFGPITGSLTYQSESDPFHFLYRAGSRSASTGPGVFTFTHVF